MNDLESDIASLMSDIVMHYDMYESMPEDWLDQLDTLLFAWWNENEIEQSH